MSSDMSGMISHGLVAIIGCICASRLDEYNTNPGIAIGLGVVIVGNGMAAVIILLRVLSNSFGMWM